MRVKPYYASNNTETKLPYGLDVGECARKVLGEHVQGDFGDIGGDFVAGAVDGQKSELKSKTVRHTLQCCNAVHRLIEEFQCVPLCSSIG